MMIRPVLYALALLTLPGLACADDDNLVKNGFKKHDLTPGQISRLNYLKVPPHKFVPVKRGDDQSWLYVDPVQCRCYYYAGQQPALAYKDMSWGDKVANYNYWHGQAMDAAMMEGPGEGEPITLVP